MWAETKLPDGAILVPGVITHSTVLVEHPELVAERILRYAKFMGRENVIAGADCGFATFADNPVSSAEIAEQKLKQIVLAAEQLRR